MKQPDEEGDFLWAQTDYPSGSRPPAYLNQLHSRNRQGSTDRFSERNAKPTRRAAAWSSQLIDYVGRRMGLAHPGRKRQPRTITLPRVFSFIDDPDTALDAIGRFVTYVRERASTLHIEHAVCRDIDLCAESVLDALAIEVGNCRRMHISGAWPKDRKALKIVMATGLPKVLGVALPQIPGFSTYPLRSGGPARRGRLFTSPKERVTNELVRYVDGWYQEVGFSFTLEGRRRLGDLVGEVLANAEEHSEWRTWWVCGYLNKPANETYGDCHLTLFNFGPTLAESLQTLASTSPLRREIELLVDAHTRRGYFGRDRWSEDSLWTLYALQEGATRFFGEGESDRGFGTAEMIEAFELLGKTEAGLAPRMCVVSGHTHIVFDGTYRLAPGAGSDRRIIAFNSSNDLNERPDLRAVRTITNFFPGTLISMRFYLDPRYLDKIVKRP